MGRVLFAVMCACSFFAHNQTVLNSSMEIEALPHPDPTYFSMSNCKDWYMTYNSSDWLSPLVNSDGLTFGYQPHTGLSHGGFAGTATISGGNAYKEMITGTITGLVAGQTYRVSYFVRNDNGPTTLEVGAYISSAIPTSFGGSPYNQVIYPQIEGILLPDGNYHEITGCFTAGFSGTGYITLGVFKEYGPSIEGQVTNYIHIDDVTIQLVSAPPPVINFTMQDSYCPASDIILDWSSSSGYTAYSWFVSTQNGDEIFVASGIQSDAVTQVDIYNKLTFAGEFPSVGNCYKVTLQLYNSAGCYVEHSENFCMINPTITISDNNQPHCEGTPFQLTVTGAPSDWLYTWSDGQSGVGLTTISTIANSGVLNYTVSATTSTGCNSQDLFTDVVVHQGPNLAPALQNLETHFYVQQMEEICIDFYSVDNSNETVLIDIVHTYPPSSPSFLYSESPLINSSNPNHHAIKFCLQVSNFWDSGLYTFNVVLSDNNVCGEITKTIPFTIDVLCPSCPENLYIDYRNPDHDPFFPGTIDAANNLYLGTIDDFPGHTVDPGNSGVHFTAKQIVVGPGWQGTPTDYSWLPSYTCSNLCTDCCTPDNQLTYDPPAPIYFLTPNGDEIDDVFYVTDYSNPYDAYRSTYWQLRVWPYSVLDWYPIQQIIWSQNSLNSLNNFSHACFIFETPTPEYPYNTFFWDGDFQLDGSAFIEGDLYFYNAGDPVPPGVYRYIVDLRGCKPGPGMGIIDHHLEFEGLIVVLPSFKASEDSTEVQEFYDRWINNQLATIENDNRDTEIFRVYPNPTNGDLFLTIPISLDSEITVVEILDVTGKLVLTTHFYGQQYLLYLGELQRGSYFMRVTNGTNEFIEKIILD